MLVREQETRRSETATGVMTTLASPTQGGSELSLWRVEVPAGASGPLHEISTEQIWTFLAGGATVQLGEQALTVTAGDTVVLPAGVTRRLTADEEAGFTAICTAPGTARASVDGKDFGVPSWIA
ncbi:cupin domain-containing protein [Nonomuraea sp. NPDC050310]|uniref:cupin domain-containing protein n=1 Tax=unclassified Nonomuraea TaxID=2593643 RepID=UPI00340D8ECD